MARSDGSYSAIIKPLNDDDMERYMTKELVTASMGINTFNEPAIVLIVRSAEGNLRLCHNLCYASLIEAARETKKTVSITHVNNVLVQPHSPTQFWAYLTNCVMYCGRPMAMTLSITVNRVMPKNTTR